MNAGHNLPYLSRSEEVIELRATGMPLGLMPEQTYAEQEVTLIADDRILFYIGGLGDNLIEFLLHELHEFTGEGWEREDAVTLVWLRKNA